MGQRQIMLGGQLVAVDDETGAVLVKVEDIDALAGLAADDETGAVLTQDTRAVPVWTLLRTVTASDTANPATTNFHGRTGFVDLLLVVTGGSWGSCVVEIVGISTVTGEAVGYLLKMPFRDGSDSVILAADQWIPGIAAGGDISVKITSLSGVTELEVYIRET